MLANTVDLPLHPSSHINGDVSLAAWILLSIVFPLVLLGRRKGL